MRVSYAINLSIINSGSSSSLRTVSLTRLNRSGYRTHPYAKTFMYTVKSLSPRIQAVWSWLLESVLSMIDAGGHCLS